MCRARLHDAASVVSDSFRECGDKWYRTSKVGNQSIYLAHTQPISDGTHTEEMESSCNGAHLDGFFNHDSSQRQSLEPSAAHGVHWLPSLVCDAARPPPSSVLSHVAESLHKSCARRRHLLLRRRLLELHCHTGSKARTRSSRLRHTYRFSRARKAIRVTQARGTCPCLAACVAV